MSHRSQRRVLIEIKSWEKSNTYDLKPIDEFSFSAKMTINDKIYNIVMSVTKDYPFKAPIITFSDPILHQNVKDGLFCKSLSEGHWSAAHTMSKWLEIVEKIMNDPNNTHKCVLLDMSKFNQMQKQNT